MQKITKKDYEELKNKIQILSKFLNGGKGSGNWRNRTTHYTFIIFGILGILISTPSISSKNQVLIADRIIDMLL